MNYKVPPKQETEYCIEIFIEKSISSFKREHTFSVLLKNTVCYFFSVLFYHLKTKKEVFNVSNPLKKSSYLKSRKLNNNPYQTTKKKKKSLVQIQKGCGRHICSNSDIRLFFKF